MIVFVGLDQKREYVECVIEEKANNLESGSLYQWVGGGGKMLYVEMGQALQNIPENTHPKTCHYIAV